MATYAEKIIKLEEKAAKYGGKIEQWERFGNNVQNLSNTFDKINHSVDIPAKLPVRVLTVTVGHLDSGEKCAEWQKMSASEYHDFYRGRHGLGSLKVGTIPAYLSAKFGGDWTTGQATPKVTRARTESSRSRRLKI